MGGGTLPGTLLAFDNMFSKLDFLVLTGHEYRSSVLPQLDGPCILQAHGKPTPFCMQMKEKWIGTGVDKRGGGMVGEKGRETCLYVE